MRLIIPIVLFVAFIAYIAWLAFVKREAKKHVHSLIYPGLFFFTIWAFIFYMLYS